MKDRKRQWEGLPLATVIKATMGKIAAKIIQFILIHNTVTERQISALKQISDSQDIIARIGNYASCIPQREKEKEKEKRE